MRKQIKNILVASLMLSAGMGASAQVFEKDMYKKALWMTARFYGTQRSGAGNSWLIADHEPTNTTNETGSNLKAFVKGQDFVKDADGDYDLTGGWFDCGDHVRFGQTEFYSAYMLLLGYSEFPAGYDDYYSADYIGYRTSKNYTWAGKQGKPNGIPDILDEVKYATDFFKKCVRDEKTFYFQVGDADNDHAIWCTSPVKATLSINQGGEAEGSRPVKKASGNVTSMVSLCGATLALMSKVYKPFDPEYAQSCLEKAKTAYKFATTQSIGNSDGGSYYPAKEKHEPDLVILGMEMYRATGDESYLNYAISHSGFMNNSDEWNHSYSLCYNNTEDLAYYLLAQYAKSEKAKERLAYYVNDLYKPSSGYMLNKKNGGWGILRFPANQAFVLGLYNKINNNLDKVDPYSLSTIEYIMGSNSLNYSFIVGLTEKSPKHPHHRNYYGEDGNNEAVCASFNKIVELGYMVGGALKPEEYTDDEKSYTSSEGGIDYNAGLVSALGYINSILNTVNINKFGHPTPNFGEELSLCGSSSITLDSKVASDGKKKFTWTLDNVQIESSTSASSIKASKAGKYTCTIDSAGEWETSASVVVTAQMPEFNLEDSYNICKSSMTTFDATLELENASYQWSKDGKEIAGATKPTLTVHNAGEYKVTASAVGCPDKSFTINVTSNMPTIKDASSNSNGKVTLTVDDNGSYAWYDAAEGGNKLGEGNSFTTKISQDTYFYVEDASSFEDIVGPTTTTFNGLSAKNWGTVYASFNVKKKCSLTGLKIYVLDLYNNEEKPVSVIVQKDGEKTTYKTLPVKATAGSYSPVTLSEPIEFGEGSYMLTIDANGFLGVGFFENTPSCSTFAHNGENIEFTGSDKGSNSFPGLVDWNIQSGTGCTRAAVLAKYDENGPLDTKVATTKSDNISVYPNPVKDVVYIDANGKATVEIINALGKVIKTANVNGNDNAINVSDLNQGIYAIRIKTGKDVKVTRIVKK